MDDLRIINRLLCHRRRAEGDDVLKELGHKSHPLAGVSDAEVLTVAVVSAMYFQNHHERALFVMKGMKYLTEPLSTSEYLPLQQTPACTWLVVGMAGGLVELLGQLFARGCVELAFIEDSIPVPVCKRVRATRCKKLPIIA